VEVPTQVDFSVNAPFGFTLSSQVKDKGNGGLLFSSDERDFSLSLDRDVSVFFSLDLIASSSVSDLKKGTYYLQDGNALVFFEDVGTVHIFDLSGRKVYSWRPSVGGSHTLPLSKGIYVMSCEKATEKVFVR
jgi:hypothetical protein